ncbi:probable 26S proteasome non-ATPase regulatory subunit 3 [Hetaerina americana]|uniref:probable 26S proteasome non-ATPase regulatory subunit 3 n=1 Tax=Hetaerina americana TaxID=62018 RepID=UPI003A7F39C0
MVAATETVQDVEMKSADSPMADDSGDKKETDIVTLEDIREHARQMERAVQSKEPRFALRVLRTLPHTRRRLTQATLRRIIHAFYPTAAASGGATQRDVLLSFLDEPTESELPLPAPPPVGQRAAARLQRAGGTAAGGLSAGQAQPLPEVDAYLHLLVLVKLLDARKYSEAVRCSDLLMAKVSSQNRRSIDLVAAKCYFYHSRAYELTDQLEKIRGFLHGRLRTATLRSDYEGQAVLINCLLRNYLHYNLYDQADKLVSKSVFPESASNNEWARFLYYLGRIKATQLEYSAAHKHLVQAARKAPQYTAVGFKQTVQKLAVTVELLLGDIPDRQMFRHATVRRALAPYFQLTQAVRMGNLRRFGEVLDAHGAQFRAEHTFPLILRLRHNVIKTAVRSVALSYSRISLADIARKLTLDSPEDAEFIVAKAIRDGVIEATVDHEKGFMRSRESADVYGTREPQLAFHQRITFCLQVRNHSVRAMRYPPKSYSKDLESAEERREREQQDLELAKEMAEEEEDGFP